MVVFTCQYCNSSLRRNGIEKHYTFNCRKKPALTCMDCLKDFLGDEYVGHLTCITEDEKYGGLNYVPKPKGVKQNKWLEACRSVRAYPGLTSSQYSLIRNILQYENIPRHPKKFHNFVMNVSRQHSKDETLVNSVLELFEKAAKQAKENAEKDIPIEKGEENKKVDDTPKETEDLSSQEKSETFEVLNETKKKKKKKSKTKEITAEEEIVPIGDDTKKKLKDEKIIDGEEPIEDNIERIGMIDENSCEDGGKTKKRKKNKESKNKTMNLSNCDNQSGEDVNEANSHGRSSKRKSKGKEIEIENTVEDEISTNSCEQEKKENCEGGSKTDLVNGDNESSVDVDLSKLSRKERKRKLKQLRYEAELKSIENVIPEDNLTNGEEEAPKSKKKKLKNKGSVSSETTKVESENKMEVETDIAFDEGLEEDPEEEKQSGKFDWGEVIIEVLKSREDKEMSLKRLGKKVINEYLHRKDTHETYEKLLAKFNKKVKKTIGVRVLKDCAKLIPNESDS